ncbi:DapH/DapD/GlmU-related protein [Insolitispirillum peregrinum]|uniref:DapH/DapD/GlmU-related protein n=1 Tax=Insolitispirillum peregrinum TaxID=80876 RepID=UPI0036162D6F
MTAPLIALLGWSDQAPQLLALLQRLGSPARMVIDDSPEARQAMAGQMIVQNAERALRRHTPASLRLVNGCSTLPGGPALQRRAAYAPYRQAGFCFPAIVAPEALVAATAEVADGCQIFADAIVRPAVSLGFGVVLGRGAIVSDDSHLADHVLVSSRACIGEQVHIGEGAFIGAGCTILDGVVIGARAVIAPGALVQSDVPAVHMITG